MLIAHRYPWGELIQEQVNKNLKGQVAITSKPALSISLGGNITLSNMPVLIYHQGNPVSIKFQKVNINPAWMELMKKRIELDFKVKGSDISGNGSLNFAPKTRLIDLRADDIHVSLQLLEGLVDGIAEGLKGSISGSVELAGDLDDIKSLEGKVRLRFENCSLDRLNLFLVGLEDVSFRSDSINFSLSKGILRTLNLNLDSDVLSLKGALTMQLEENLHDSMLGGNLQITALEPIANELQPLLPLAEPYKVAQGKYLLSISGSLRSPRLAPPGNKRPRLSR